MTQVLRGIRGMDVAFSQDQELLRGSAREVLERECPMRRVREADLFKLFAELGWTGLTLPDAHGGAGLGVVELGIVLEQMGRALVPAPYFSSAVLASHALELAGDAAQQQRWLPRIASGALQATVALHGEPPGWDSGALALPARAHDGGIIVSGVRRFVLDGATAELLLIPVSLEDAGMALAALPHDTPGLGVKPMEFVDATRRVAALELADVALGADAVLCAAGSDLLDRLLDRARVALCAEMCGGAGRVLELCVDFARTREQFGRPIGSFQAIQHKCADMLVAVEAARSAAYAAAWALDAGDDDAHLMACMAKAYCSDAYRKVTDEGIQIHGGLGFTWEQDLHLYFKRARASEAAYGDATWNREEIARILVDSPTEP
jgi:alkylation response protein AidB-like acyl-CoA dehydrogenase